MVHLKECTLRELEQLLAQWQEPAFRARQIFSWIYRRGVLDYAAMNNVPVSLRRKLEAAARISALSLVEKRLARDGTEKCLFRLPDSQLIEAVSIPADNRVTGCISSQAGCKFACVFCCSGQAGFKRDLTCGEMLDQIAFLRFQSAARELTHLVFMGTGEPLDNYDNVLKAIRLANSEDTLHIGARRITISTCGIVPALERLAGERLQIELSVSLHAADDATRSRLMPVNKRYPLKELIAACRHYNKQTGRQVTFEYILINGVNSSLADARKLGRILEGFDAKVNLIPMNAGVSAGLQPPQKLDILFFRDALVTSGVRVTLRKSRGQDIEAACGQLRLRYEYEK